MASPGGLPLAGRRVLLTRPEGQTDELSRRLIHLGAVVVLCPTVRIVPPSDSEPLDDAIRQLDAFDWAIFTSVNGVRAVLARLDSLSLKPEALRSLRLGAIGPATARALTEAGLKVAFVPAEYVAESIVEDIGDVSGQSILLPRADIARKMLAEGLRAKGARVREVVAYCTVATGSALPPELTDPAKHIHIATFTSPSTVHNFAALLGERSLASVLDRAMIAVIGPITARAAEEEGLQPDVIAQEHTVEGLVNAIMEYVSRSISDGNHSLA